MLNCLNVDLTHIFVKPTYRRKGIGSQLVRIAVDKAAEAGIPFSVCSEPAAHDFFLKLGFKDTVHGDIDLRKWAPENSGFGNFRLYGMVLGI
jgi:predicted N-acetyltransferase YhbS